MKCKWPVIYRKSDDDLEIPSGLKLYEIKLTVGVTKPDYVTTRTPASGWVGKYYVSL